MTTRTAMSPSTNTISSAADTLPGMKNTRAVSAKRSPVASSTSGYWYEMCTPHRRHFPRRTIYERSGMLSYQRMVFRHVLHRERPETIVSSVSNRKMTTLRKLPMRSPMPKKKNEYIMDGLYHIFRRFAEFPISNF